MRDMIKKVVSWGIHKKDQNLKNAVKWNELKKLKAVHNLYYLEKRPRHSVWPRLIFDTVSLDILLGKLQTIVWKMVN